MRSKMETEIKLRLGDAAEGRRLLRKAGFRVVTRRVFEDNVLFDAPDGRLRATGLGLRVRRCGRRVVLTFKGPAEPGRHKSREELELEISDAATFTQILARVGFEPTFRYVKYRTEYAPAGGDGLATLDETPIGDFLELEGSADWIDHTAERLGFAPADYITTSYAGLYWQHREANPSLPEHMLFAAAPRIRARSNRRRS
jgi:adenylate cyclase class 2